VDAPEIRIGVEAGEWPPKRKLQALAKRAVKAAVEAASKDALRHPSPSPSPQGGGELSLVFTDDAGMRRLNAKWRGKDKPTNVLSFPQKRGLLLGDVILAAETVAREAALASKPLEDHMAHLIIHGFLHLLGYDHQAEAEAAKMEQLERVALETLGISDPYAPATLT
jgi:probable rRNA maturation factor